MKRFDYNSSKHQSIGLRLALMFTFEGNFGELMNPFDMDSHELREEIEKEFELPPAEKGWDHNHHICDWLQQEGPRFMGAAFLKLSPDSLHLNGELGIETTRVAENDIAQSKEEREKMKAEREYREQKYHRSTGRAPIGKANTSGSYSGSQGDFQNIPKVDPNAPKAEGLVEIPDHIAELVKRLGGKVVSVTTVKLEK